MSHTSGMNHVSHVIHMNESCHTGEAECDHVKHGTQILCAQRVARSRAGARACDGVEGGAGR